MQNGYTGPHFLLRGKIFPRAFWAWAGKVTPAGEATIMADDHRFIANFPSRASNCLDEKMVDCRIGVYEIKPPSGLNSSSDPNFFTPIITQKIPPSSAAGRFFYLLNKGQRSRRLAPSGWSFQRIVISTHPIEIFSFIFGDGRTLSAKCVDLETNEMVPIRVSGI